MVSLIESIASLTITLGAPLLLASLGEIITERSGNLNLGIEGIMITGALASVFATINTGNPYIGVLAAMIVGMAMASIHGFLTITLKSDQVISGVMLTLLGLAVAVFGGQLLFSGGTRVEGFGKVVVPVIGPYLVDIPIIGVALFRSTALDYFAILMVPVVWYFLYRTNIGLEIMAVGEDPATADTMGVPVARRRYLAVLIGGAFAGIAGAHIALAIAKVWLSTLTAGRGWIAIAIVIFAQWRPSRAFFGAFLFGGIEALTVSNLSSELTFLTTSQFGPIFDVLLHPSIMRTYPYVMTIVVLLFIHIRRGETIEETSEPAALLQPYIREKS